MSIINAFIRPDVAMVGTDTEGVGENGERFECSKLYVLNHVNAVVAFRGYMSSVMYSVPGMVCFNGSFDDLAEAMPGILNTAQQAASAVYDMSGKKEPDDLTDVQCALVGYSPKLGRMTGHLFNSKPNTFEFDCHSDMENIVAPGLEDMPSIEADREGMATLAKAQCEWVRQQKTDKSAGGRFFIAEVTKGGISVKEAFTFADRA